MGMLGCTPLLAGGDDVGVALFVMGRIVGIISILSHQWRRHREAAYNARLKQLMIERGMTADEIQRVVQATPGDPGNVRKRCDRLTL